MTFNTKIWFAVFAALFSLTTRTNGAERPNVLFIISDDLNMNVGCYGDTPVKTPNIDRLAARGVRFDRAYCQFPLCNPSRASMMTGLRPDTLKVYDLQTNLREGHPRITTLPQHYKNNGYFSARVGKIYHYGVPRQIGSGGMDDPDSWDLAINPRGRDKDEEGKVHVLTRGTGTTLGFSMSWLDMDGRDEDQTDGQCTTESIRLLERFAKEKRPFFLGVGFFRPHTPYVAPKKWFGLYPKDDIKLSQGPSNDLDDVPPIALTIRPANYALSDGDLKDCVRAYYAAISFVDAQLGRLMESLERLGLEKNTVVVFVSDHGYMLGEHGQWQKQLLFDESNRVPLIFAGPGIDGRGSSPRTVELLDIYPTLVELCGLPKPKNKDKFEGKSLAPLLEDPQAPRSRPAYSQVQRGTDQTPAGPPVMGRSVRTERWRYIEWDGGKLGSELYDHVNDPHEYKNLAKDQKHANVVMEMQEFLRRVERENPKSKDHKAGKAPKS
jgi:iduronate 2-sulfatase